MTHKSVHGVVGLCVEVATLALGMGDSGINETSVSGLVSSSQDQRWVGGGILQSAFNTTLTQTRYRWCVVTWGL